MKALLSLTLLAVAAPVAQAADVALYPTGPAQDSSYVRFVNGGAAPLTVQAAGNAARLSLDTAKPVSSYLPVAAGKPVRGTLQTGKDQAEVNVSVAAGEFASVVAIPVAGKPLSHVVVREQPDEFNAARAAVGLVNADAACKQASLLVTGRNVALVSDVAVGETRRRMVNPVALSVQLSCDGKPAGEPVTMGTLVPGERYTLFAVPGASGSRLIVTTDVLAR